MLLIAAAALTGCRSTQGESSAPPPQTAAPAQDAEQPPPQEQAEVAGDREADVMLDTGYVLRKLTGRNWGLRLMLPIILGLTDFQLSTDISLDQLATIAVVPTLEFRVPLNERWTLQPFIGVGLAYQTGAAELIGDSDFFGLANIGLRATRWQRFAERHWFGFTGQARYDTALTTGGDSLDDWGVFDLALELRRDFGDPSSEDPRFQGGVYVQGYKLWDPVSLEISGVSPYVVDDQVEFGISLGSTSPYKLLGITLPTVFIGVFVGEGLRGIRFRTGRL